MIDVLNEIQNNSGLKKMNKNATFYINRVLILLYAKMTQHSCFTVLMAVRDLQY